MKMLGSKAAGKLQNKLGITSKEKQDNEFADGTGLEWYDFGARMQDPQIGRWFNVDPMADKYNTWSPYTYCLNNPVITIDPDGRSTHTDRSGNVLGVYDDDDEGVYSHGKKELKKWDNKSVLSTKGKGVRKEGETETWEEFALHDKSNNVVSKDGTNYANTKAKLSFGESVDESFRNLQQAVTAKLRSFEGGGTKADLWLAKMSRAGADLDIKSAIGVEKGVLFNGKYVSGESLGNIFFGMNLSVVATESYAAAALQVLSGSTNSFYQDFWTSHMMAAGAYHNLSNTANNPAVAPYYGEINYTGLRVAQGYFLGGAPLSQQVLSILPQGAVNSTKIKR
ncbi:MAG: RHS repeat-associated core domain-containing protein [Chitinophagaceae bacterium]